MPISLLSVSFQSAQRAQAEHLREALKSGILLSLIHYCEISPITLFYLSNLQAQHKQMQRVGKVPKGKL